MKSFSAFLDEAGRCWPGHRPVPGKKPYSPGSCVKEEREGDAGGADNPVFTKPKMMKVKKEAYEADDGALTQEQIEQIEEVAAWQRKEGKSESGGLNRKGIESYRRENPGSKLSMAVTTPPSKLKPGSKAANRRKSFCARMGGMPGPMKDEKGRPTRKALSLRKWNC